jgi:hypothetical protein
MPRPMKTTGRSLAIALLVAVAVGACTGDGDGGVATPTGGTGGTAGTGASAVTGPTPVVSGAATSGTYEYVNAGLHVTVRIEGTAGTMEVDNGSGHELEDPGFYILDARDGHEIDGVVSSPAPIADQETATFDISFQDVEVRNIGLLVLLFGADNYGAFVRTG